MRKWTFDCQSLFPPLSPLVHSRLGFFPSTAVQSRSHAARCLNSKRESGDAFRLPDLFKDQRVGFISTSPPQLPGKRFIILMTQECIFFFVLTRSGGGFADETRWCFLWDAIVEEEEEKKAAHGDN